MPQNEDRCQKIWFSQASKNDGENNVILDEWTGRLAEYARKPDAGDSLITEIPPAKMPEGRHN